MNTKHELSPGRMSRWGLGLFAMLGFWAVAATAAAQSAEGFGEGYTQDNFHVDGAPLMKSFYFRFSDSDHHIRAIEVQPHKPSLGTIAINFQDKNGDDEYYYHIQSQPYYGQIWQRSTERVASKGADVMQLQAPPDLANWVFVIRGFYIYYHGTDHHIDQISVLEEDGRVTVAYNDKNDDDTFWWELDYAYVPRSRFTAIGTRSGTAKGAARASIPVGSAVLRGFDLNFSSNDHHIKEVGLWMPDDGNLDIYYSDKNQDDKFAWRVKYGILGSAGGNTIGGTTIPPSGGVLQQ
ncbi:MAG: hypothetical protein M3436_07735 [Pseudomonadota bacterium]|nr:hypothetical protein [Pseudomonadota bacterium]